MLWKGIRNNGTRNSKWSRRWSVGQKKEHGEGYLTLNSFDKTKWKSSTVEISLNITHKKEFEWSYNLMRKTIPPPDTMEYQKKCSVQGIGHLFGVVRWNLIDLAKHYRLLLLLLFTLQNMMLSLYSKRLHNTWRNQAATYLQLQLNQLASIVLGKCSGHYYRIKVIFSIIQLQTLQTLIMIILVRYAIM